MACIMARNVIAGTGHKYFYLLRILLLLQIYSTVEMQLFQFPRHPQLQLFIMSIGRVQCTILKPLQIIYDNVRSIFIPIRCLVLIHNTLINFPGNTTQRLWHNKRELHAKAFDVRISRFGPVLDYSTVHLCID